MTTTNNTRYIDSAETAKLAIKALAQVFPGVKFSRRTKRYAGGSSVYIDWTDGPTVKQVEEVVGHMCGSTFDGMQDLMEYHDTEVVAGLTREGDVLTETVSYGNDFIFCTRECSNEAASLAFQALKKSGEPVFTGHGWETLPEDAEFTVSIPRYGAPHWITIGGKAGMHTPDSDIIVRSWWAWHDLRDMANPVKIDRYA